VIVGTLRYKIIKEKIWEPLEINNIVEDTKSLKKKGMTIWKG
jgi:hypothetical protein